MSKVSKEFWVSDGFAKAIEKGEISQVCISGCNVGFSTSPKQEYIHNNKVTITCEIDREVMIKESKLDKVLTGYNFGDKDILFFKQKLFGGGENEWIKY